MSKESNVVLSISWGERLKIQWKNIDQKKVLPITWLMVVTILTMWILYLFYAINYQG